MHICKKSKFVFLANPKTGTRSILSHLRSEHDIRGVGRDHSWSIPAKYKKWSSFSVVRNPYTRMASIYWVAFNNHKFRGKTFKYYLNHSYRPQGRYRNVDAVVRFENMDEELKSLPFWPKGELPHHNDSGLKEITIRGERWKKPPPWEEMLTPEIKHIIYSQYQNDFELFGYEK
tara:strand:- start:3597 stop:4118 length:522 start_codon:yes stop_codon:yes gene_type:complete